VKIFDKDSMGEGWLESSRANGESGGRRTFSAGICLHELIWRAGFGKLRCKTGELGENFVD